MGKDLMKPLNQCDIYGSTSSPTTLKLEINVVFTLTFGWVNRAGAPRPPPPPADVCPAWTQRSKFKNQRDNGVRSTTLLLLSFPLNSCRSYSAYAVNDVQRPTYAIVYVCPQNIGRKWVSETQINAV